MNAGSLRVSSHKTHGETLAGMACMVSLPFFCASFVPRRGEALLRLRPPPNFLGALSGRDFVPGFFRLQRQRWLEKISASF
jgi:hypothetical protein